MAGAALATFPFPPWIGGTAPDPRPVVPRPMGVAELLDAGFRVLRSEYRTLAPIVAAIAVPLAALSAWASRSAFSGQGNAGVFGSSLLAATAGHGMWVVALDAVVLVWPALVAGPVCRVVTARWFGRIESRRAAWQGLRRTPALLAALLLVYLMTGVGLVLLVLPALAVWALFHLTLPAAVVEGLGPFGALGRAAGLAGRRYGSVLALAVLAVLIGQGLSLVLGLVPSGAVALFGLRWGFLVVAAGSVAVQTVTWSWSTIVVTLLYLDVRARTEGLDLIVRATSPG